MATADRPMEEDNQEERELEIVKKHAIQLLEHFENVQIFVSKYDSEEGTVSVTYGEGNWFSRLGQVKEFVTKSNERLRKSVREEEEDD
jgi:hypothetical protein